MTKYTLYSCLISHPNPRTGERCEGACLLERDAADTRPLPLTSHCRLCSAELSDLDWIEDGEGLIGAADWRLMLDQLE